MDLAAKKQALLQELEQIHSQIRTMSGDMDKLRMRGHQLDGQLHLLDELMAESKPD